MSQIRVAPAGCASTTPGHPCTQGTSWLELFCAFELMGGRIDENNGDPAPMLSLRQALMRFIATVKRVVILCCNVGDAAFFTPSKSTALRLSTLGFTNFVPCVNGNFVFPEQVQQQLLPCLVQLKGHLSKAKLQQLNAGSLSVPRAKLPLRG